MSRRTGSGRPQQNNPELFQELKAFSISAGPRRCAEIRLPNGTLIALNAEATPEQIETILGMLAC